MVEALKPRWIDTSKALVEVAEVCAEAGRFALDTEADSLHSYFHKVCLIQVTAAHRHFVVDPLTLTAGELGPLWQVVSDPAIPVVMHGADYDVRVLDRDYGVHVSGLEDTQIMAHFLGERRTGLGALVEREFGVQLDKRYQRANWARRPLPESLIQYAAADTAYAEVLAQRLKERLVALGRWEWATEEFRKLEAVRHVKPSPDPLAFERIKGARSLTGRARDRVFTLHSWREERAKAMDVPPFKVLGNPTLMELALRPPADLAGLAETSGVGKSCVRRWGAEILACLHSPRRAPARKRSNREGPPEPAVAVRLKGLLAARDVVARDLGLEAGLVCPRALAQSVAKCGTPPRDAGEIAECGLNGWRLEVLGEAFVSTLKGDAPK